MAQEIEIKLRISDPRALRLRLKRLGVRLVGAGSGRVHESNLLFDTPQGDVAKRGQLLRIRTETRAAKSPKGNALQPKRVLLTFKRPVASEKNTAGIAGNGRHKVREELELEVADATTLTTIFEGLGMRGWFRYEKHRTTFCFSPAVRWAKGLLLELDETPIGTFLELEGPPDAIDRAARELGFSPRDYILQNYLSLYVEDCRRRGVEPGDMLFAAKK